MPGAGFKRQARVWRAKARAMIDKPFQMVKERMESGTACSCFAQNELEKWIQSSKRDPAYETLIKNVAGISYAGKVAKLLWPPNIHTQAVQPVQTQFVLRSSKRAFPAELGVQTVSTLLSFILAMTVYPEVQRKAQEQLDDILGMQRLPTLADREKLPFIECVVWECLRWNPVLPLGLVHLASKNDEYRGYFIPKGTSILPNVWSVQSVFGFAHILLMSSGQCSTMKIVIQILWSLTLVVSLTEKVT